MLFNFDELLELVAWAGGLWFFLVSMVIGPVVRWKIISKMPPHIKNIGNHIFFGTLNNPDVNGDAQ